MSRATLLLLTALLLAAACQSSPQSRPRAASPAASPTPSPPLAIRPPFEDLLGPDQVGLSPVSGADHVSKELAAEQQTNQPLALNEYSGWGWVDEATRVYARANARLELDILLLSSPTGAEAAFAAWADDLTARLGLSRKGCPTGLQLDDCDFATYDQTAALVGRIGPYVFRLLGSGVDVIALAGQEAATIKRPASS